MIPNHARGGKSHSGMSEIRQNSVRLVGDSLQLVLERTLVSVPYIALDHVPRTLRIVSESDRGPPRSRHIACRVHQDNQ